MVADTLNMRDLRQWLCWRSEEREGKPTKIPYSPITGGRASSTTPETWAGYEEAVRACKEEGYTGVGFVFTPEDDLCGVDLDGCLDPLTEEIEPWAWTIIKELDSYTEISPSGTGVHILVRAALPEGRNRKGRFEAYDRGRYFTVTGRHLAGSPQRIENRQEELQCVVRRVFGEESTNGHTKPVAVPEPVANGLSDSEVIQKALAASNSERFSRLWNGDTEEYDSHSEADLALCGMLAFWTGGDATRIDTLFRQSGLYRKKWERNDYCNRTITEALSGKTEFYEPPRSVKLADGTERKVEEKEERRNQADRLIGYALEDVQELFVDQYGAPHALIGGEPVALTSRCYSWLRRLMWEEEGRSVSGEYLKMAAGTLSAHAEFSGEVRELYTRAAWQEGVLYYKLRPGKVVRIGPGGWTFEANPPVLFRHYVNLKALPDPQAGGSLDVLDGLVNLNDDEEHFYAHVHELGRNFTLNKLAGQRIEIRVYCEAAGMMPQLHAALEPYSVPVYSCSGFDSLTFKHQLARWFSETYAWRGKVPVMLHLGDYDPDGESIFDVISEDTVAFLGRDAPQLMATYGRDLLFNRVALTEWQVDHYGLPTAPPKETSSRTKNWKGSRTCQLEALPPDILRRRVVGTVEGYLDGDTLEAGREEVTARRNIAGALPSAGGAP